MRWITEYLTFVTCERYHYNWMMTSHASRMNYTTVSLLDDIDDLIPVLYVTRITNQVSNLNDLVSHPDDLVPT
jgi:hypothetical protein